MPQRGVWTMAYGWGMVSRNRCPKGHIQNTHFLSRHICPTLPAPGEGEETGRTWKYYYPVRSRSRQCQHQGQAGVLPIIHLLAQPQHLHLLIELSRDAPSVGRPRTVTLTTARRCWYLLHPAPFPPYHQRRRPKKTKCGCLTPRLTLKL